jgi:hypothetical protein
MSRLTLRPQTPVAATITVRKYFFGRAWLLTARRAPKDLCQALGSGVLQRVLLEFW